MSKLGVFINNFNEDAVMKILNKEGTILFEGRGGDVLQSVSYEANIILGSVKVENNGMIVKIK